MADTEARDIQLTLSTIKGSKAFDQNENIDNTNANYHMQTLQTLKHNNTQNDNDDEWSRSYDINNTETEEDNNTETEEEEKELVAIYNQVLAQDSIDTPLASSIPSVNHKISKAKSCTDAKDINETKTNTSSKQISTETTCLGTIMMDSEEKEYDSIINSDLVIKNISICLGFLLDKNSPLWNDCVEHHSTIELLNNELSKKKKKKNLKFSDR
eukprot:453982_1